MNIISKLKTASLSATLLLFSLSAMATTATGSTRATTLFTTFLTIARNASIALVTIAFIFIGYQMAFGGKRFNDVLPVIIGAIIVGMSGILATFLAQTDGAGTIAVLMPILV
jgi:type IV secretion system protein VirB2